MAAAVASNIASPVSKKDQVVLSASGLTANDTDGTPFVYYLKAYKSTDTFNQYTIKSQRFSPDSTGAYAHLPVTFPVSGTWTVEVCKASDDSVIATASLTVS